MLTLFNLKTLKHEKQILLSTGILVSGLLGAQVARPVSKIPAHLANISATKYPKSMEIQPAASYGNNKSTDNSVKKRQRLLQV